MTSRGKPSGKPSDKPSDKIVGIDLGTSNSVVAYVDELDQVRTIGDADGVIVHPSVVSFHPSGGVVVGVLGKVRKVQDPKNTIYSAKRMIGQRFSSPAVRETARRVAFEIKEGANEQPMVVTRSGEFAIPEISAIVLDHMRKIASAALGEEIGRAVVTVPASFTDVQRASTATAGALAGLTVVRVLNEPTAAALAYGATKKLDEIIAVYDFGGGTFDITILQLQDQVYTVLGTSGDAFLGGEDLDERLVEMMVAKFLADHRIDLRTDEVAMMRLRAVAEHTKIELSRRSRAVVKIEQIAFGARGAPITFEMQLTREELIASIGDLVDRTFASCKEAMVLAGIKPQRIADVILVGGTTQIPLVRDRVAQFFGLAPRTDVNPDDAIATGAALQASSIEQMLSRTPARGGWNSVEIPVEEQRPELSGEIQIEVSGAHRLENSESIRIELDPEPALSKIAEVKRPKSGTDLFSGRPRTPSSVPKPRRNSRPTGDPAILADRAKNFFGDLFGDTPVKPEPVREPVPKPVVATKTQPIGKLPLRQAAIPAPRQITEVVRAKTAPVVPPTEQVLDDADLELLPPIRPDDFLDIDVEEPVARHKLDLEPVAVPAPHPAPAPRAVAHVVDVTPRSLGIATVAGFCEELIRRNTQLPAGVAKAFVTSRDRQDTVRIVVCQGESRRLDNNVLIGDLVLQNLPARPRGDTQIDVEFVLDASGILHVSARDATTGVEQRVKLDLKGGMPAEDLAPAQRRLQQLSALPTK